MMKKGVSKNSIKMFRMIETMVMLILLFVINWCFNLNDLYKAWINIIIILIYLIIAVWYEKRRQVNTYYYINNQNMIIEKGVILKQKIIFKIEDVEGIEYTQDIFQKIFNLYTINFYTSLKNVVLINIDKIDLILFEKMSDNFEI